MKIKRLLIVAITATILATTVYSRFFRKFRARESFDSDGNDRWKTLCRREMAEALSCKA